MAQRGSVWGLWPSFSDIQGSESSSNPAAMEDGAAEQIFLVLTSLCRVYGGGLDWIGLDCAALGFSCYFDR